MFRKVAAIITTNKQTDKDRATRIQTSLENKKRKSQAPGVPTY